MAKSQSLIVGLVAALVVFVAVGQVAGSATTRPAPAVTGLVDADAGLGPDSGAGPTSAPDALPEQQPAPRKDGLSTPLVGNEIHTPALPLALMPVVAEAADGYVVFVEDAGAAIDGASGWPQAKLEALVGFYEKAVAAYTSDHGFGDTELWATAFGISRDNPIRVVCACNAPDPVPARAGWVEGTAIVTHYKLRTSVSTTTIQLIIHELAHIWDGAHGWALGEAILGTVENPEGYPTAKARDQGAKEDFAESVTAVLWPGYAVNLAWSDDVPGSGVASDGAELLDRYDYVETLLQTGL